MSEAVEIPMSVQKIMEIISPRYPFLFVDVESGYRDGEYIVGKKHVTANEPQFTGHFPGRPVMPGVLMLEALAQLGAIFAKLCTGGARPDKLIVFSGADEVRFRKLVVPGDELTLKMVLERRRSVHWRMKGTAHVGDTMVTVAFFMATEI